MTPQEFIEEMGAGWNLGNTYECHSISVENLKYRYWGAGGNWKCAVTNSGGDTVSSTTSVAVFKNGKSQEFSIAFTYPSGGAIAIKLTHPKIETGLQTMQFYLRSVKINGNVVTPLVSTLTFPMFSEFNSVLSLNCSSLFSNAVTEDTPITLVMEINREPLNLYPTSNETILSEIRSYYNTAAISAWGAKRVTEAQIKAVAAVGFKAVRIPCTWKDHCDPLDNLGHVHVDTEFLDHIASIINMIHSYGMMVMLNMHHDDQDWLKTGYYLTDSTVSTRYKDIWEQIATYFKDYGDWLSFASNNETRNNKGTWEGAEVTSNDIYGLMQIQKDFYDTVRNIAGNEHRICFYPTYAAKQGAINSTYLNPNDSSDTGIWGFPYDDPYGIAEVHPYNNGISIIQSDNKKVYSRGLPVVYGEFGVNASQTHDNQTCINQAYMVAYAKYHGIGTFLWDDNGGMQMLHRDNCTMDNSNNFDKLWNGAEFNFIPSLIASATLKKREILLNNRRTSCYAGDKVEVYLDTSENVIISNEGSSRVALNGNAFIASTEDIDNLLAISYIGEYNTINVTVDTPEKWVETIYDNTYSEWEHKSYSLYDAWKVTEKGTQGFSLFYPITSGVTEITVGNTTSSAKWTVAEYSSSKTLLTYGSAAVKLDGNSEPYVVSPNVAYVAIFLNNPSSNLMQDGTFIKIKERNMNATETKDETSNYVDSISDYNNYNISIYRTIEAAGGMEYTIDMGMNCDIYIIEYNGNKIEHEDWYRNGDSFTTNLFTKTMRVEIVVPNNKINTLINNFNSRSLMPKLSYTDYSTHVSQYKETYTPINTGNNTTKFYSIGDKIVSYNGNYVIE